MTAKLPGKQENMLFILDIYEREWDPDGNSMRT